VTESRDTDALSPYEGADDLNSLVATQLDGVLFMEGEGEPGEIAALQRELRTIGADSAAAGAWLSTAMESAWACATQVLDIDELADLLGERHRIIANDWQGSSVLTLVGHMLGRAADLLDHVDFSPGAVRADLRGARTTVGSLHSSAEIVDRAADLLCDFGGLVHDNERRWRVFRARVATLVSDASLERPD
jgi:hypothetical protein